MKIFRLLLPFILLLATAPSFAAETERLIVFEQSGNNPAQSWFRETQLPKIDAIGKKMGVPVYHVDVAKGAPGEVVITPLILYQNHKGNAIYQGRTTTLDRIQSFIRTSRYYPQDNLPFPRENTPVWNAGRAQIAAPIKITPLEGTKPAGFDPETFQAEARKSVERGLTNFQTKDHVALGRADRSFYFDFYPYLSEDRQIYLSVALFSQFHCKTPIYKTAKPFQGDWKDRKNIFAQAAAEMEKQVTAQMINGPSGDAFTPVPEDVSTVTYADIGFAPPEPPTKSKSAFMPKEFKLPLKWKVAAQDPNMPPRVSFRFPSPLDAYFGEAGKVSGSFELKSPQSVEGATGRVEVSPVSITMGVSDLNTAIQGEYFLDSENFPQARFIIDSVSEPSSPLRFGALTVAQVKGRFTLKGKTIELTLPTQIEPVIDDNGRPNLIATTGFRIDLKEFKITEADGPEPQNHTLDFSIHLKLEPEDD